MRSCVCLLTSSFPAGMCHRHARISCIPFSLLDLPELCQLVLIPLLAPSKTCPIPVCIILSFTASKSGLWGFSTYFLRQHYALTCSTLVCTHCGRSSTRLHSLSGCVLGGSQPWLWLPHSALSPPPPPSRFYIFLCDSLVRSSSWPMTLTGHHILIQLLEVALFVPFLA